MKYVTEEMLARINEEPVRRTAAEPVSQDALRRFVQATMEDNPIHLDAEAAGESRFGAVVLPPLYPVHAFRRALGAPDPLDRAKDEPDFDGSGATRSPLTSLGLPLKRRLNAGSEIEFFRMAEVGDVITETTRYSAIEEKKAGSGEDIVLETREVGYVNQRGETLVKVYKTSINR